MSVCIHTLCPRRMPHSFPPTVSHPISPSICPCFQPCPALPQSQHIFVDPSAPADDYKLAYNCLACPDNSRTYNDGYHIIHHTNSRLHWSELPSTFIQQLQLHDDKDGEMQSMGAHRQPQHSSTVAQL